MTLLRSRPGFRAHVHTRPLLLAAWLLLGLAACSGGETTATPTLTTINVSYPSAAITVGQTTTAAATGLDQNGVAIAIGSVTWSSGAPAVATVVVKSGLVTGVGAGAAQIIATAAGKSGAKAISVALAPATLTSIQLSVAPLPSPIIGQTVGDNSLMIGQPGTATLTARDQYGLPMSTIGATFSSSAPTIGSVNATTGAINTVAAGKFVLTAVFGSKSVQSNDIIVRASEGIIINEVESSGGTPGDWIELYNPTTTTVNLAG